MRLRSQFLLAVAPLGVLLLAGCAMDQVSPAPVAAPIAYGGAGLRGQVHGGQQPLTGSRVYLYAVATTNGGAAASLLNAPGFVTTALDGSFSISNDYSCPANSLVYLLAVGGNPGLPNVSNPAIALGAGLGPCSSLGPSTFLTVNEVTTVAMTQALANYATSYTQVGSATNLAVPFANIASLVDSVHGTANGSSSTLSAPTAALNTLANSIAACVNSSGLGAPCSTLFAAAPGPNGSPTDTFQAALNIAQHPTANVATIYGLGTPNSVFVPTLPTAPASWQLQASALGACIVPDANSYLINTTKGNMYYQLRPDVAPKNVANFLAYVNNGSYSNSILHRAIPNFVVQGGGYKYNGGNIIAIPTFAPVVSEFNLSNTRGTLAMALAGAPDTATNQFFFNQGNNAASLDTQAGGYTVIGQPVALQGSPQSTNLFCFTANPALLIIDAIAADTIVNAGTPFDSLPVVNYTSGPIQPANLEYVNSITPVINPATMPAMPVLNPGQIFNNPSYVSITDSTPGAVIYYATYVSVPDPQNPRVGILQQQAPFSVYTAPVYVSGANGFIQAYSTAPGFTAHSLPNAAIYGGVACSPNCGSFPPVP